MSSSTATKTTSKPSPRKPAASSSKSAGKSKPAAAPTRSKPTQRVLDALTDHGPLENDGQPWDKVLEPEQRERALKAPEGLRGKALATYVLTGQDSREQIAAAKAAAKPAAADGASSAPATSDTGPRTPREGSAMHAAVTVLADASEPMTAQQIYDAAVTRGLAGGLKGKTPVATLAAQMATANKKGQHVERTAPGRYQLRTGAQA